MGGISFVRQHGRAAYVCADEAFTRSPAVHDTRCDLVSESSNQKTEVFPGTQDVTAFVTVALSIGTIALMVGRTGSTAIMVVLGTFHPCFTIQH